MKKGKGAALRVGAILGAVLLMAAFSALPAVSLYWSERAALDGQHARGAKAGTLSLTADDIYLTRMLKKQKTAKRGYSGHYESAAQYPISGMTLVTQSTQYDLTGLLDGLRDAGVLPDAWYRSVTNAIGADFYVSADSLGFTNIIAFSHREEDRNAYAVGLTVEEQTRSVVGFWAAAPAADAPPAPERAAVLAAYREYLGVEAGDWAVPVDSPYAENSLYSASMELMLSMQTGAYQTWGDWSISGEESRVSPDQPYQRRYLCVNACWFEAARLRAAQAYERSFGGEPDAPCAVGALRQVRWAQLQDAFTFAYTADAAYELAPLTQEVDPRTGRTRYESLILKIDYETGVESPLCAVPGCAHEDASCPAFVDTQGVDTQNAVLGVAGDRLLLLRQAGSLAASIEEQRAWLEAVDTAGGGRVRLCTFPLGCEAYSWNLCATDGRFLIGSAYFGQEGRWQGVRVDLDTGELTVFELEPGSIYTEVIAPVGAGLLIRGNRREIDGELCPDAAASEAWGSQSTVWLLYDLATGLRREVELPEQIAGDGVVSYQAVDGLLAALRWEHDDAGVPVWRVTLADVRTGETRASYTVCPDANQTYFGGFVPLEAVDAQQKTFLRVNLGGENENRSVLLDMRDGEANTLGRYILYPDMQITQGQIPLAQTGDGRWLTAVSALETAWGTRWNLSLAPSPDAPGSAVSMWAPAAALG